MLVGTKWIALRQVAGQSMWVVPRELPSRPICGRDFFINHKGHKGHKGLIFPSCAIVTLSRKK